MRVDDAASNVCQALPAPAGAAAAAAASAAPASTARHDIPPEGSFGARPVALFRRRRRLTVLGRDAHLPPVQHLCRFN